MRRKNALFLIWVTVLTAGLSHFYRVFEQSLNEEGFEAKLRVRLQKELEHEKLKTQVAEHKYISYQQQVAVLLPSLKKFNFASENENALAQLAVATRMPAAEKGLKTELLLFENARQDFNNAEYAQAAAKLKTFLKKSTGLKTLESTVLLIESQYLSGDDEGALKSTYNLVEQFPDHPTTGMTLLRMGKMLEKRRRPEEAQALYRMVQKAFPEHKLLQKEAKVLVREAS